MFLKTQTNNVQLFPTSETLSERSRKEGEDSERKKSKSIVSLIQEFNIRFFSIQKDKMKLKEGKKSHKKRSVLDEEIASDSDVEE